MLLSDFPHFLLLGQQVLQGWKQQQPQFEGTRKMQGNQWDKDNGSIRGSKGQVRNCFTAPTVLKDLLEGQKQNRPKK